MDLSKETKGMRSSYSPEFSDYPSPMRLSMMNDKKPENVYEKIYRSSSRPAATSWIAAKYHNDDSADVGIIFILKS